MVRGRPIVLSDGDYLLPVYRETVSTRRKSGADSTSLILRSARRPKNGPRVGRIRSRMGNIQPAVVQLTDNDLVAYCRRGGGYEPIKDGFVVRQRIARRRPHVGRRAGLDFRIPTRRSIFSSCTTATCCWSITTAPSIARR